MLEHYDLLICSTSHLDVTLPFSLFLLHTSTPESDWQLQYFQLGHCSRWDSIRKSFPGVQHHHARFDLREDYDSQRSKRWRNFIQSDIVFETLRNSVLSRRNDIRCIHSNSSVYLYLKSNSLRALQIFLAWSDLLRLLVLICPFTWRHWFLEFIFISSSIGLSMTVPVTDELLLSEFHRDFISNSILGSVLFDFQWRGLLSNSWS